MLQAGHALIPEIHELLTAPAIFGPTGLPQREESGATPTACGANLLDGVSRPRPAQYSHSAPIPTAALPSAPVSAWSFKRLVTSTPTETPLSSGFVPTFTPIETLSLM